MVLELSIATGQIITSVAFFIILVDNWRFLPERVRLPGRRAIVFFLAVSATVLLEATIKLLLLSGHFMSYVPSRHMAELRAVAVVFGTYVLLVSLCLWGLLFFFRQLNSFITRCMTALSTNPTRLRQIAAVACLTFVFALTSGTAIVLWERVMDRFIFGWTGYTNVPLWLSILGATVREGIYSWPISLGLVLLLRLRGKHDGD